MSNTERRKMLNYRNASGISPNPDNIDYGEIAIGYKKDNEAIYIKNTTNEIVDFTPISIVNLTYNELKNLRDNSKLKPSQYYRITDFVTTVANDPEARSAGHPFDIVLLALSANKLAEEGWAMMHDNTYDVTFTDGYTKKCWIYDYGNGINIVDCESLLGFDGLGNDEITINQEQKTAVCNTFGTTDIVIPNIPYNYFQNSKLEAWKIWYCLDNDITKYMWADTTNGKGVIYRMIDEVGNDCPYDFKNVQFKRYAVEDKSPNGELADLNGTYIGYNSDMKGLNIPDKDDFIWMYTFSLYKENEYIDYSSNCLYGPFTEDIGYFHSPKKGQCVYNTLSNTYGSVDIDGQFYVSLILNNIVLISEITSFGFPNEMVYNTFDIANFNMTLKDSPEKNKFGNKCYNIIAGGMFNSFGNNCTNNSLYYCHENTFGNRCEYNLLGCYCEKNTFGNDCDDNTFGNVCFKNTFGHDCSAITFGNYCYNNTFGNECFYNTFGNDFRYNTLGNLVQHIVIPRAKIYNTQILNGTKGDYDKKLTIAFTPETTYSQFAGFTSDGVLKIWVEADDPHDGIDCGNY